LPLRQPSVLPQAHSHRPHHSALLSTLRMNTCKSVSKQRTLTFFRMNTYTKTGGGGAPLRITRRHCFDCRSVPTWSRRARTFTAHPHCAPKFRRVKWPHAMTYGTLPSRFLNAIDSRPNQRAQMFRHADSTWESITSAELLRRVAGLSMALVELGVKPGDRVGLFAANRPEWHTADFAINGSGAVTVPIYFHESPDRMTYILKHSGARVVIVAGAEQLEKLLPCRAQLPDLDHVIVADAGADLPTECLRYETLIASAAGAEIAAFRMRAAQVLPGQLCTIIYTSGTTGEPKGVMLTHNNMSSNVTDSCSTFDFKPATDVALSFLPLAHVYGRMLDYIYIFSGGSVAYVEAVDLVAQALLEIRPTVIAAVPRFFEKIYSKLMEQGNNASGIKRKLFDWAVDVARRAAPWRNGAKGASPILKAQWALADKLVYKKLRAGMGGKLRLVFSGGAPLSKDLAEFFWSIGIPIYQGYGLTETSPI